MAWTADQLKQYKMADMATGRQAFNPAAMPPPPTGIRGMAINFLPTIGGAAGAAAGSVVPGAGTLIGGGLGSGLGEYLRQKLSGESEDGIDRGDIVQESLLGAIPGVLKGAKALKGAKTAKTLVEGEQMAIKGGKIAQSTEEALLSRKSLVKQGGEALTRTGSGLKVGKGIGDVNRLDELSQVAAKYTGTPKVQLRKIKGDMDALSASVDNVLEKHPTPIPGSRVNERLANAITDATDERFMDLDLEDPAVQKIIGRYSGKFAQQADGKGINDIIKTMNPIAERANKKLMSQAGQPLTARETAILAMKRAGDDVLSEIPEVRPFKQQMAQLFDINPQVAAEAEKGFSIPFMGGMKVKAPYQAIRGAQSYGGAVAQGAEGFSIPGLPSLGTAGKLAKAIAPQAATRAFAAPFMSSPEEQPQEGVPQTGTPDSDIMPGQMQQPETSPFDSENVQATVQKLLANGGTMKDVTEYLNIAKTMQALQGSGTPKKKTEAMRAQEEAADLTDTAIRQLQGGSIDTGLIPNKVEGVKEFFGQGDQETLDFNTTLGALKASIAKARAGTSFTPNEEKLLNRYTPSPGDTAQQLRTKLTALQKVFASAQEREANNDYAPDIYSQLGIQ